jgi:ubiquinone/menaquinone biosynthesis C-methylase UbiE
MANASSMQVKQVSAPSATADLTALKIRQQAAWSSGNYAIVGTTLQIVGEQLCETLNLKPGAKVLDVAAGNGMASLAAARRWGHVTSTDYVPALLQNGRTRAEAEGHTIEFIEADAEALPFDDGDFDTVLSTFGVMFTPNQDRAAGELLRVCKPKGQIGLANWTPDGFIGQVFKTLARYLPPSPNARSPALWGTRARLAEMFGAAASDIKTDIRQFNFRYRSPKHFLEVFEAYYGPINRAFAALDMQRQTELRNDLHALIVRMNRGNDGTMLVPGEYLEVVITKA